MTPPATGAVTARHFPAPQPLLPEILELHARWRPTRTAVVCGGTRLNWAALGVRSGRVAAALQASGMAPGARVAVLMDNRLETLEVLLGAIRAGCCSVPLNLSITDDAMTSMIEDSGAAMVIATADQAQRLGERHPDLVRIRASEAEGPAGWTDWNDWLAAADDSGLTPVNPASVAPDTPLNIIYSSGTTGRPKGILHTQRGRLDWAMDLAQALRYHGAARTLVTLPLYSNISWVMLLCTLVPGGTLVLQDGFDTGAALEAIQAEAVTHTAMVPLQYQRLLDDPRFAQTDVSSMQAMMSCGSPLHAGLKERVLDAFACGVIELYGLTEGVITTLDPEDARERLDSVGRPLVGTDIEIVDDADRILGPDADGEIVARGRITMPGYHGRPDADEEATFTDPEGRVWLRTGDLGRRDADGFLRIVGRKKDMILSGGQNIYPADIETVLLTHEAVLDAAVIGVESPEWGERPLAVIERTGDADDDPLAIMEWLNARIGRRQRVVGVEVVDELPRNPNGKILKRSLREWFAADSARSA